jgi:hypothetical protein
MRKVIAEAFWDGVAKFCHYFGIARKVDTAVDFATLGEFGYEARPGEAVRVYRKPVRTGCEEALAHVDRAIHRLENPPFDWSREPDRFPASPPTMLVAAKTGCAGGRGRRVPSR